MYKQDDKQERVIPKLRFPKFKAALGWKHQKLGQVLKEPQKTAVKNPQNIELLTVKLHSRGIELTGKFPLKTEKGRPYYHRFKNEILVGRQNFHNGGIGIVKAEHDGKICSNAISSFNVKNDILEFIFKYISRKEYYTSVIDSLGGTGQKEIKKTHLLDLDIFIPTPEEQQKIADCLSSIDELIELQEQKLVALRQHKKGLMQQLFPSHNDLQASKQIVYPKLRFPQFKDCEGWKVVKLGNVFKRITLKNKENNQNVLTISAQYGLISQLEFFNKSVAAKNITGYYLLHKGDFAYNKSYSNGYPWGAIKPLKLYDKGVVSTLYICFRLQELYLEYCSFFEHYFETGLQNPEISQIAQEGARNHGLLNVSVQDFFENISICLPSSKEQQAIADCLSSLDKLIREENEQIGRLKDHKKGLMQQLFPKIQ